MMELKPNSYIVQISLYLKNRDPRKAYQLSKEFASAFPGEMASHYLLALASLKLDGFEEAKIEGRKAFNVAQTPEDMLTCAFVIALAYYALKEYDKGYEVLLYMEKKLPTPELEKLLIMFSLAMSRPDDAAKHEENLFRLNAKAARDLLARLVKSLP